MFNECQLWIEREVGRDEKGFKGGKKRCFPPPQKYVFLSWKHDYQWEQLWK